MNWDEFFMRHVYLAASKSKDPRTKIGAILVKDGVIISEGFNGFARKVKDLPSRYFNKEIKYKFICHGEHNSVLNAARRGESTLDSICYTQGIPCNSCAIALIQAGIKEIVIHNQWPEMNQKWKESIKISKVMFKEAGVKIRIYNEILDLQGLNNGEIVEV